MKFNQLKISLLLTVVFTSFSSNPVLGQIVPVEGTFEYTCTSRVFLIGGEARSLSTVAYNFEIAEGNTFTTLTTNHFFRRRPDPISRLQLFLIPTSEGGNSNNFNYFSNDAVRVEASALGFRGIIPTSFQFVGEEVETECDPLLPL